MYFLLNKNILISIIIIITLLILFTGIVSLYNSIDVYAYSSYGYSLLDSVSRESDIWLDIFQLVDNETDFGVSYSSDGNQIYLYTYGLLKKYYHADGHYQNSSSNATYEDELVVSFTDDTYDAPEWFLMETSIINVIYLKEVYDTISINTSNIPSPMLETNLVINHDTLTDTGTSKFELFNSDGVLIETFKPNTGTTSTTIDIPKSNNKLYLNFKRDPNHVSNLFYIMDNHDYLTFEYIDKNVLNTGQAYKVNNTVGVGTITFDEILPSHVYMYFENPLDEDDNNAISISPNGSLDGISEIDTITTTSIYDTYFVILDDTYSQFHTDSSFSVDNITTVENIPYIPGNISEKWESLPSWQIGILPGADGQIDYKIDMGVEELDTYKDEMIYTNTSNKIIKVDVYPSTNSKHYIVKQKKMLDDDLNVYWTDLTNPTSYGNATINVNPNERIIVMVFQGTINVEYPLEYIDGAYYIEYVYGVDYTIVTNNDVYGIDPESADGTGITNNTNSAISYPNMPTFDNSNDVLDGQYTYNNPYTDEQSALETIEQSLGTVQNMIRIMFDNPVTGIFVMAFGITIPIAIFKFIRG